MLKEIKGLLFEANRDAGGPSQESEQTPRDEQREGVFKEQGEEGLRKLDLIYDLIDATMDEKRKNASINIGK